MTHSPNSGFANESFSYDANGNRNASGQTTGTGNEIQSDGTYNYAYDPAGNLISKTSIATGAATLYKYDYRNRLTEVDSVVGGVASNRLGVHLRRAEPPDRRGRLPDRHRRIRPDGGGFGVRGGGGGVG